IALAHVGARHADDVTQEVFCSVFASLATLRDPAALPGFMCSTARNAARDLLRRHRRTPPRVPADELIATGPSPAVEAEQKEQAQRVLACMQELPEAYRETLALRLVAGLSGQEIAERTGLTHGSVRVNLHRGVEMLRKKLSEGSGHA
ncbi:MAG TPA: sigma-70 family RNA polymerase sigma factor, partial [Verrucomicrobiae bacterium]|nr:sigma-70 family RNA polymerase sigma factor [Verrucomicrobiae bacterium]